MEAVAKLNRGYKASAEQFGPRKGVYGDNVIAIRDNAYGSNTVAGWLHSPRNVAAAR
jgi:hypothetical protein